MAQWIKNPTAVAQVTAEVQVQSPAQRVKGSSIATAMMQVTAMAQIQSLAWKLPYATGVAIKKKKKFTLNL